MPFRFRSNTELTLALAIDENIYQNLPFSHFSRWETAPSIRWRLITRNPVLFGGNKMAPPILVSIVIPCYNQALFLAEAIESALCQTYSSVEVIVVDDGSTDSTSHVAKAYSRVHYIRQENRGVTSARNAGLRITQGDYVLFLDADDRLLPNAVKDGVTSLELNPNYALAFGTFQMIDINGNRRGEPHFFELRLYGFNDFLERNFIGNPGVALHRKQALLAVNGFDLKNQAAGDYDLYLRISKVFPITCHTQTVLEYRRHGRNMSDNPSLMLSGCLGALKKQWRTIKQDPKLRASYYLGLSYWKQYYGEQLVFKLYEHLALRSWSNLLQGVTYLLIYYPERLTQGIGNKLWFSYVKRQS